MTKTEVCQCHLNIISFWYKYLAVVSLSFLEMLSDSPFNTCHITFSTAGTTSIVKRAFIYVIVLRSPIKCTFNIILFKHTFCLFFILTHSKIEYPPSPMSMYTIEFSNVDRDKSSVCFDKTSTIIKFEILISHV